jgi:hypothetical protein
MASGKLSPQSVFFDFGFAQAVVVGADIRFQSCHLSLSLFLLKKFIQNRRLGIGAPPPRFLLQIGETSRRKRKRAPLLNVSVPVCHSTVYHTINMIISIQREKSVRLPGPRATRRRHQDAASCVSTKDCFGFLQATGYWQLANSPTRPFSTPSAPGARFPSASRTRPRPEMPPTRSLPRPSCAVRARAFRPAAHSAGRAC